MPDMPDMPEQPFLCRGCGTPKHPKGKLARRKGKFGEFFGCSRYPNCKHTEQLSYSGLRWPSVGPLPVLRSPPAGSSGLPIPGRSPLMPGPGRSPIILVNPTTTTAAAAKSVAGVHGFGAGFGPPPSAAKKSSSVVTPFQGGEARPARRPPSPAQPAKKRWIVDGRVVIDSSGSATASIQPEEMPTPQETGGGRWSNPQSRRWDPNDT